MLMLLLLLLLLLVLQALRELTTPPLFQAVVTPARCGSVLTYAGHA